MALNYATRGQRYIAARLLVSCGVDRAQCASKCCGRWSCQYRLRLWRCPTWPYGWKSAIGARRRGFQKPASLYYTTTLVILSLSLDICAVEDNLTHCFKIFRSSCRRHDPLIIDKNRPVVLLLSGVCDSFGIAPVCF